MKRFFTRQYRWKRLQYPSRHVAQNPRHPLHEVHVEMEHTDLLLHMLIDDILASHNKFNLEDVLKLLDKYQKIKSKIKRFENRTLVTDYEEYIDCTTGLLHCARNMLEAS